MKYFNWIVQSIGILCVSVTFFTHYEMAAGTQACFMAMIGLATWQLGSFLISLTFKPRIQGLRKLYAYVVVGGAAMVFFGSLSTDKNMVFETGMVVLFTAAVIYFLLTTVQTFRKYRPNGRFLPHTNF